VTRTFGLRSLLRAGLPVTFALLLAGCGASTMPPITTPAERLATAKQLSGEGQCVTAVELLKTYIASSAGSADVDQAIYFLGECYMKLRDYSSAAIEFERLVRDYPESDSAAAASFQLGAALYGQTRPVDFDQEYTTRAIRQWDGYLRAFPGHWLNAEAQRRVLEARTRLAQKTLDTATLYYKLKLYEPARVYYRLLINEYGDTVKAPDGWLGLAMCDVQEGKKQEAIERLRDVEERFGGTSVAARAAHTLQELEN
jgi:outer membrane protein assembly factor BamD